MSAHQDFPVEQQPDVVSGRAITIVIIVGVVVSVIAVVISGLMLKSQRGTIGARDPAPRVAPTQIQAIHQTPIERERHGLELRETQQLALEKYGWVDRDQGLARIPIQRAIDLVIQESQASPPAVPAGPAPSGSGGPQQ
jgi:hypothetical protein